VILNVPNLSVKKIALDVDITQIGLMLLGAGSFAALSPLPLLMAIALTALGVLVAFLQAYVFTMLTCMYLNDALHPGH
jgi:F-type H+-transporting ATPase subunit a